MHVPAVVHSIAQNDFMIDVTLDTGRTWDEATDYERRKYLVLATRSIRRTCDDLGQSRRRTIKISS